MRVQRYTFLSIYANIFEIFFKNRQNTLTLHNKFIQLNSYEKETIIFDGYGHLLVEQHGYHTYVVA